MRWTYLLFAVCSATCQAQFGTAADREDRERAVVAIQKLGGKVEVDSTSPDHLVVKVSFRNTKVTDKDLSSLKVFTDLAELDLSHTDITSAGLLHVRGLTKLTALKRENARREHPPDRLRPFRASVARRRPERKVQCRPRTSRPLNRISI